MRHLTQIMLWLAMLTAFSTPAIPNSHGGVDCDLIAVASVGKVETEILDEGLHRQLYELSIQRVLFSAAGDHPRSVTAYAVGGIRATSGLASSENAATWCLKNLVDYGLPWAIVRRGTLEDSASWLDSH